MKICDVHLATLLLVLVIDIAMAQQNNSSAQRYCGSKLADVLKVLCKTKYYETTTKRPKKRDRVGEFNKGSPFLAGGKNEKKNRKFSCSFPPT